MRKTINSLAVMLHTAAWFVAVLIAAGFLARVLLIPLVAGWRFGAWVTQ